MNDWKYAIFWIVLTFFPVFTAWKKRWVSCAVYTAGWLFFLYSVLQDNDGWDDLANIATLIVVVIPIYLIASILWLFSTGRKKRRRR